MSPAAELLSRKALLIFDLDGTLIDTTPIHARAFQEVFAPLNIVVDYSTIAGMKTQEAVFKLLEEAGVHSSPQLRATLTGRKRQRALELIGDARPLDGAAEFVSRARARFRMAVCTSGSREATTRSIAALGLEDAFETIVNGEDVPLGKPDPASYLEVLRRAQVEPHEALAFEDADLGAQAAARAGIAVQRVANGGPDWLQLNAALGELRL